jgi:hypothetical protein
MSVAIILVSMVCGVIAGGLLGLVLTIMAINSREDFY